MTNIDEMKITHTVIKDIDIEKYLDKTDQAVFQVCVDQIKIGRALEGRGNNKYIVINTDEIYANEVAEIMRENGHWEGALPAARNIFEVIEEKQKRYYKLQKEMQELINTADNIDVLYKGKKGILLRIYTNSTADILLESDEGEQHEIHVNLSDLY